MNDAVAQAVETPSPVESIASTFTFAEPNLALPLAERARQVLAHAQDLYRQGLEWIVFYRELLGAEGMIRRYFPSTAQQVEFEQTEACVEIQQMVARLRAKGDGNGDGREPTRVITVRMPKSVHEALRAEAEVYKTSMNKLCISKLLQIIDNGLVPQDHGGK